MFAPGSTLYFTFAHATAGLASTAFTTVLSANGSLDTSISISISEIASGVYTASFDSPFVNDVFYNLIIFQTSAPTEKHSQSWFVRARTLEKDVAQIKSYLSSLRSFLPDNYS